MRYRAAAAGLVALALLGGCDDDDGVACTEEFRTAVVTLVDDGGDAVIGADVRTYLVRTGEQVPVTSILDLIPGSYLILDDGAVALIEGDDEAFRVTADAGAAGAAEAIYRFAAPDGCHIEKVSGPHAFHRPGSRPFNRPGAPAQASPRSNQRCTRAASSRGAVRWVNSLVCGE